ncbi:MAG: beta-N-acetylglucosaminidase domain-containing protein [Oscillospiraceae bacterium]|nr:beta-N-acetylglucosaminidase domain-containing protein [Oscillospiraceae bacterium]
MKMVSITTPAPRRIISLLMAIVMIMGFWIFAPALSEEGGTAKALDSYQIYPIPQSIVYKAGSFDLTGVVNICLGDGGNPVVKNKIAAILDDEGIAYKFGSSIYLGENSIVLGVVGDGSIAENYFNGTGFADTSALDPNKGFDGYVLGTREDNIIIMGRDSAALYNGVVTLKQMLAASHTIQNVLINDFADSEIRGTIEGYYGTPWSFDVCKALIEMSGDYKMNTFIYAPKDDPYHFRSWDVLYPPAQLEELRQLVKVAEANNVTFIWTTHVGATMDFFDGDDAFNATRTTTSNPQWVESNRSGNWVIPANQKAIDAYSEVETYQKLFTKLEQIYGIGVRQFGFLIDDIGFPEARFNIPYYTLAANKIVEWGNDKGDVGRLMVCPSYYGQDDTAYNGRTYMRTLKGNPYGGGIMVVPATATGPNWTGEPVYVEEPGLDESAIIMWTGDGTMSNVHYDPTGYSGNSGSTRMGQGTYYFYNNGALAGTADPTGANPIYNQTGMRRLPLIWWNYPCNDFIYNPYQLMMGPTPVDMNNNCSTGSGSATLPNYYGLNPNAKGTLHGVVSNPMQQGIASEIALFGVADYCWNMDSFDAIQNWKDSFYHLFPEVAESLFTFSQHNQWARTGFDTVKMCKNNESLALKPYIDAFQATIPSTAAAFATMNQEAVRAAGDALMPEIDELAAAVRDIQDNGSALLLGDIDPWLKKGANQCRYIKNTFNMYRAYFDGDFGALMASYNATETDRLLWTSYTALGRGTARAVTVGAQYFQPFIDTLNTKRNTFIGSVASADFKAALSALIAKANLMDPTGSFLAAVNAAQTVAGNANATVRQVAEAGIALEAAMPAAAPDAYTIYPIPQKIVHQATSFALTGEVNVYLANAGDIATKTAVAKILTDEGIPFAFGTGIVAGASNIILGVDGDGSAAEAYFTAADFDDVSGLDPANGYDGYVIGTAQRDIVIMGRDDRALYYGAMTLKQMLGESHTVRNVLINDWANVRLRGIIQGYYGHMWDWGDIGDMMDFISEWKMNTFLYGPKDDPYHRANWRDPYPAESMVAFGKLADLYETNNVNFVWALHPAVGQVYDYNNPADWDVLLGKIKSLYDVGVRQFAVFMDDSNATAANNTVTQFVAMMNRLQGWADDNGCAPFIICPTHYSQSTGTAQQTYWRALQNLDPRIAIMYTGNDTIGRIDEAIVSFPAVPTRMGRPITMWFNYPVNDFGGDVRGGVEPSVQGSLNLGPVKMVSTDVTALDGLLSNPMTECLPNKVALFSIANYAWNIKKYDWGQTWEDTFDRIQPEVAESYKIISTHSSCPPNHNFISTLYNNGYFPESEHLTAPLAAYSATGGRTPERTAQLAAEFNSILAAIADMRENCADDRLLAQIEDHLESFRRLLDAGNLVLSGLTAADAGDLDLAYGQYVKAQALFSSLDELMVVPMFRNHILIKMGNRRIKPFISTELGKLRTIANSYNTVPTKAARPIFASPDAPIVTTNMPERVVAGNLQNLVDGNLTTSVTMNAQPYSLWIQLELPEAIPLFDITLWQTNAAGSTTAGGYLRTAGYLEYSLDGVNWGIAVGATNIRVNSAVSGVVTTTAQALGNTAKYIRLRMVDQNATNTAYTQRFQAYAITYNATAANRPGETPLLPGAGPTYNAIDGNVATGYYPEGNELIYTLSNPADQVAEISILAVQGYDFVPLTASFLTADGWVEVGTQSGALCSWFSHDAGAKTAVKLSWPAGAKPFIAEIYTAYDRKSLAGAIAKYESLANIDFTADSWAAVQAPYAAAVTVNANAAATQNAVSQAAQALWGALNALEKVSFGYNGQPASVVIRKGMKYQINIETNNPDMVFYVCSNANATVDANGLVTAVKTGSAVITVIDAWAQRYFTIAINITS